MSQKSTPEEEYFARIESEKKAALKEKLDTQAAAEAAEVLRAQHYNRCGRCGNAMTAEIFKGVEIDVCPSCNAVLLDPGELEQLVGADKSGMVESLSELFSFSRAKRNK